MNRTMTRLLVIACLAAVGGAQLSAQSAAQAGTAIVKKLNVLLAAHCARQPVLELTRAGTVVRKDRDGGTMTIDFSAIEAIDIDADGEAHVLLKCRGGKRCIETTGGAETSMPLVVFSISPAERGGEVARLFKDLRASLAGSTKKQPRP